MNECEISVIVTAVVAIASLLILAFRDIKLHHKPCKHCGKMDSEK